MRNWTYAFTPSLALSVASFIGRGLLLLQGVVSSSRPTYVAVSDPPVSPQRKEDNCRSARACSEHEVEGHSFETVLAGVLLGMKTHGPELDDRRSREGGRNQDQETQRPNQAAACDSSHAVFFGEHAQPVEG